MPGAGLHPSHPDYVASSAHIAISDFVAGLWDLLGGYHTDVAVKTSLNMDATQQTQFDTMIAKVNSASDLQSKIVRVNRINSILTKWQRQSDFPLLAYDTPDDIETQLLAIDTGLYV